MKRKLLVLLCACMMLGGCSDNGTVKYDEPSQVASQGGNEDPGKGGNEDPSQGGNEDPGKGSSEDPSQGGNEKPSQGNENPSQGGSGEVRQLGAPSGREIVPVELRDAWQKAAYFADQSYLENGGNVLVSPLSLNVALGMVAEGTTGETAKELYRYLGTEEYAKWVDQYMSYAEGLKADVNNEYNKYTFCYKLANSIWVREGDELQKTYQDNVRKLFRAEAANVNFTGDPVGTAGRINSWCDEHTNGLIPEIVSPEMLNNPNLASVLVNSLYFESPWAEEWGVREHKFTNLEGKTTKQDMLIDYNEDGIYFENDKCTAFAKNYYNGFQFIGILPKAEGEFRVSDLDLKSLMESQSYDYEVHAIMPKLNFDTTSTCIVDALKAQGVEKIFDPFCMEFDKMLEGKPLYVSDIIQKCKIELDEQGTRAAAVTAIFVDEAACAMPDEVQIKEVFLDRPFAFLIYDSRNDQVVFAGKVTDIQ